MIGLRSVCLPTPSGFIARRRRRGRALSLPYCFFFRYSSSVARSLAGSAGRACCCPCVGCFLQVSLSALRKLAPASTFCDIHPDQFPDLSIWLPSAFDSDPAPDELSNEKHKQAAFESSARRLRPCLGSLSLSLSLSLLQMTLLLGGLEGGVGY